MINIDEIRNTFVYYEDDIVDKLMNFYISTMLEKNPHTTTLCDCGKSVKNVLNELKKISLFGRAIPTLPEYEDMEQFDYYETKINGWSVIYRVIGLTSKDKDGKLVNDAYLFIVDLQNHNTNLIRNSYERIMDMASLLLELAS